MQVVIHGKNIDVIDKTKSAIEKILNRLQEKYSRYIKEDLIANVGIEHYNYTYKIAIHIQLLNKNYLQCSVENNDLYIGIKQTLIPLEQQLRHLKTLDTNNNSESVGEFLTKETDNETDFIIDVTPPLAD